MQLLSLSLFSLYTHKNTHVGYIKGKERGTDVGEKAIAFFVGYYQNTLLI